jgi:integrase
LRKENILEMSWNHIDFAKNYIHFAFKEVKKCPSADGLYVPLHPEMREWLEMLIRKNNGNPFPGNELVIGKHYYNPNYELIKKKEKAVGITSKNGFVENEPLHLMRHTLETWILMKSGAL